MFAVSLVARCSHYWECCWFCEKIRDIKGGIEGLRAEENGDVEEVIRTGTRDFAAIGVPKLKFRSSRHLRTFLVEFSLSCKSAQMMAWFLIFMARKLHYTCNNCLNSYLLIDLSTDGGGGWPSSSWNWIIVLESNSSMHSISMRGFSGSPPVALAVLYYFGW